jgi:hypothetical protein
MGRALVHFSLAQRGQPPHRDHHIFLHGKILEQKVELKDEAEKYVPFLRKCVIGQIGDEFVLDRYLAAVSVIK